MNEDSKSEPNYGTAVVLGGSIAGSSAAAALSGYFENVIVLDKDELPAKPSPRKGAPHSYQYHALTVGGKEALEDLLPDFGRPHVKGNGDRSGRQSGLC